MTILRNREHIKIKEVVTGIDANKTNCRIGKIGWSDIYVQISQDKTGTTISLNGLSISLTKLGYRLVED